MDAPDRPSIQQIESNYRGTVHPGTSIELALGYIRDAAFGGNMDRTMLMERAAADWPVLCDAIGELLELRRKADSPTPAAAAANEMSFGCDPPTDQLRAAWPVDTPPNNEAAMLWAQFTHRPGDRVRIVESGLIGLVFRCCVDLSQNTCYQVVYYDRLGTRHADWFRREELLTGKQVCTADATISRSAQPPSMSPSTGSTGSAGQPPA